MKRISFSEHFNLDKSTVEEYGAIDINLDKDNRYFIEPTLLHVIGDKKQKSAHSNMVKYLLFLYNISQNTETPDLNKYYKFHEVRNNWLGYSAMGNKGHGLGIEFAHELHMALNNRNLTFDKNSIPQKIFLFGGGHGLDNISDFTVCLIKDYLLEYTQEFAKRYMDNGDCQIFTVKKVYFDYTSNKWETAKYYLPCYQDEFVMLTPWNIINQDKSYLNYKNMVDDLPYFMNNESIRDRVNTHISYKMYEEATKDKKAEMVLKLVQEEPDVVDEYIKYKLANVDRLIQKNEKINKNAKVLADVLEYAINALGDTTKFYYVIPNNKENIRERSKILKSFIEQNVVYFSQLTKCTNKDITGLIRSIWYNGKVIKEVRDGDQWSEPKIHVARKSPIKKVLRNSFSINSSFDEIVCYICFSKTKYSELAKLANGVNTNGNLIIIEAFTDTEE